MLMLSHNRTAQVFTTALAVLLHTSKPLRQREESDTLHDSIDNNVSTRTKVGLLVRR